MIGQRAVKPTATQEKATYERATRRDNDMCQRCRRDCGPIARDHRQNRRRGNTVVSNLQCLGLRCHQWKTEHPAAALEEGWAVPGWVSPAEWPAARWLPTNHGTLRLAWVLYDDAGEYVEITEEEAARRREGRTDALVQGG